MGRSMTYDQGVEMRHHKRLTANTGVDVYFAHPKVNREHIDSDQINGSNPSSCRWRVLCWGDPNLARVCIKFNHYIPF